MKPSDRSYGVCARMIDLNDGSSIKKCSEFLLAEQAVKGALMIAIRGTFRNAQPGDLIFNQVHVAQP